MDQREQPDRRVATEPPTVIVEIMRAVPPADVPTIARQVARSLVMRESRVRRLLDARVGPITKPLRVEKAEILRRVLERASVSVTTRPSGGRDAAVARPESEAERAGCERPAPARSDAFVSAVLAGMIAVAVVDGPACEACIDVVGAELKAMTGADVGSDRLEALARSRGAGNLLQAHSLLADLGPSLTVSDRRSILDSLFRVVAAGGWSVARARGVVHLSEALGMQGEAVSVATESGRVLRA
jgi:hypothetical protein